MIISDRLHTSSHILSPLDLTFLLGLDLPDLKDRFQAAYVGQSRDASVLRTVLRSTSAPGMEGFANQQAFSCLGYLAVGSLITDNLVVF